MKKRDQLRQLSLDLEAKNDSQPRESNSLTSKETTSAVVHQLDERRAAQQRREQARYVRSILTSVKHFR